MKKIDQISIKNNQKTDSQSGDQNNPQNQKESKIKAIFTKISNFLRHRQTLKSAAILIFWMFASRGLGAVRTILIARLSALEADMLNGSMLITDNLITLFVLGAVTTSILPQVIKISVKFSSNKTQNQATQNESIYLSWVMVFLGGFLSILSTIGVIFTPQILILLNSKLYSSIQGFGRIDDFILLTRLMLAVPVLFGLKSIATAFLNAKKAFSVFALDGVIINAGFLLGLTFLYSFFGISGVIWGNIFGMLVALILFAQASLKIGFRFNLKTFPGLKKYLLKTFQLYILWLFLVPAIRVASTVVGTQATQANGEISAVNLAFDLQSIFLGIVASIGSVVLPNMAQLSSQKDHKIFWSYIFKYLKWVSFLSIIGTFLTIVGTPFLITIVKFLGLLKSDSFLSSPENLQNVYTFVTITASTLFFQSLIEILYRYFTSTENPLPPLFASIIGNLSAVLVVIFASNKLSAGMLAVLGFAINNVVSFLILALALFYLWKKQNHTLSNSKNLNKS